MMSPAKKLAAWLLAPALLAGLAEGAYRAYLRLARPAPDPEGTFEIYAIGGSSVVGSPYRHCSFPFLASRALGHEAAGRKIVIHNLAVGGYSIYPEALALDRRLRVRNRANPAAVMIYSGHNEAFSEPTGRLAHASARVMKSLKEGPLHRSLLASDALLAFEKRRQIRGIRDMEGYEFYMRRAIESSLANGAVPILSTVIGNLSDVEPRVYLREDTRQVGIFSYDEAQDLLEAGLRKERAGDFSGALSYYSDRLPRSSDLAPMLRYRMGKCQQALGRYDEARREYWEAVDTERSSQRTNSRQNALLRRLAAEYDIPFVDAVRLFELHSPHGLPGNALFIDHHHPNMDGYILLGQAFAEKIAERFGARLAPGTPDAETIFRELSYSTLDRAQTFIDGGTTVLTHAARYFHIDDRLALAKRDFEAARALIPDYFSAWLGLALVEAAQRAEVLNREEEVQWLVKHDLFYNQEFCVPETELTAVLTRLKSYAVSAGTLAKLGLYREQAYQSPYCRQKLGGPLPMRPGGAFALKPEPASLDPVSCAQAALQAGQKDEARRCLDLLGKDGKEVGWKQWQHAAMLRQELKDYGSALGILKRLVQEHPSSAELLRDEGICEYLSGSPEKAIQSLNAALKLDRNDWGAHLSLGSIYESAGRWKDALAVYDRALSAGRGRSDETLALIRRSRAQVSARQARASP